MTSNLRKVHLKDTLTGRPPYRMEHETIPEGAEITIVDYDYSEIDSLVEWEGHSLVVDKDNLISFEDLSRI
jgi:hypothetical protein